LSVLLSKRNYTLGVLYHCGQYKTRYEP